MKKLAGLAAAGLLALGTANAGSITAANSDIVFYGGISAGVDYTSQDLKIAVDNNLAQTRKDNFRLYNVALGLMKAADPDKSPIGFNLAFAYFYVPTVLASPNTVNNANLIALGTTKTFTPWLGYLTVAPVEGFSIDAGLLWAKYGEAPVTILNPHINRGALFVHYDPVLFAGLRANIDVGAAKVYVGYNQGGGLFQGAASGLGRNITDAIEAGITADLGVAKAGFHIYDEMGGKNFYTLCLKSEVAGTNVGAQISIATEDDAIKDDTTDDSSWGIALYAQPALTETISLPIRVEYENTDAKVGDDTIWTFTITPTWKPTGNTFARVELAYTSWEGKFADINDGTAEDSRTVLALEIGYLF